MAESLFLHFVQIHPSFFAAPAFPSEIWCAWSVYCLDSLLHRLEFLAPAIVLSSVTAVVVDDLPDWWWGALPSSHLISPPCLPFRCWWVALPDFNVKLVHVERWMERYCRLSARYLCIRMCDFVPCLFDGRWSIIDDRSSDGSVSSFLISMDVMLRLYLSSWPVFSSHLSSLQTASFYDASKSKTTVPPSNKQQHNQQHSSLSASVIAFDCITPLTFTVNSS